MGARTGSLDSKKSEFKLCPPVLNHEPYKNALNFLLLFLDLVSVTNNHERVSDPGGYPLRNSKIKQNKIKQR